MPLLPLFHNENERCPICYKCEVCGKVAPKGAPRLLHVEHRDDGNVEREVKVCSDCKRRLQDESLCGLLYEMRLSRAVNNPSVVFPDEPAVTAPAQRKITLGRS